MIDYYKAIQNDQYEAITTILREVRRKENCNYVVIATEKCLYNGLVLEHKQMKIL